MPRIKLLRKYECGYDIEKTDVEPVSNWEEISEEDLELLKSRLQNYSFIKKYGYLTIIEELNQENVNSLIVDIKEVIEKEKKSLQANIEKAKKAREAKMKAKKLRELQKAREILKKAGELNV